MVETWQMKPPCERVSAGIQPHVALPPTATSLPPLEKVSASLVISWLGSVMFRRSEGLAATTWLCRHLRPSCAASSAHPVEEPQFFGFFPAPGLR